MWMTTMGTAATVPNNIQVGLTTIVISVSTTIWTHFEKKKLIRKEAEVLHILMMVQS